MKVIFLMMMSFSLWRRGLPDVDVMKLFDREVVLKDATVITQELGVKCGNDPSFN